VYTIAFVELCERFSYYGTQILCTYCCLDDAAKPS
jgi:dipeptide/tripeptide permease